MKLNKELFDQYQKDGWLNAKRHSTLPLTIYKYSTDTAFEGKWDEVTLRARGVVLDDDGNIVVNGFEKFFNHSEPAGWEGYSSRTKNFMFYTVTEKLDGSLIQAALYNNELVVTSSGTFDAPQAAQGRYFLEKFGYLPFIEEGKTYLFEIIYPTNRIVLDYGDKEALTLLAIRDTETGKELRLDHRFDCVKKVEMTHLQIEAELNRADYINKEGYILHFADGHRVKMKYAEYMRLHKIVAGVNEKFVWEALRDGVDLEKHLKGVPDELYAFVVKTKADFTEKYAEVLGLAHKGFSAVKGCGDRKEQARILMTYFKSFSSIVFSMLDGKDFSPIIWKQLKPETVTSSFGKGEA